MALSNLKDLSNLAKAAQGRKGKEVLTVSVEEVLPKEQARKRFRKIEELATTLLTEGQQSPIIVSPKNSEGKYVIQKGERRWRACRQAGIKTINIIVNDKPQSSLDEAAGELIENIQRDDLTALEIANALQIFIDNGWKQKDIAERIGKNISYISAHLSLLKMPQCVRELYDKEVCSDTETLNNLRLLFEFNQKHCRAVCTAVLKEGITRKQSRELLNEAKRIHTELKQNSRSTLYHAPATNSESYAIAAEKDNAAPANNQEQENEPLLNKDKLWKNVHPASLIITVNVKIEDNVKLGVIMTDRIALAPQTVWVKILDEKGRGKPICVHVSDTKLLSIEGS
jgi:ParB family chromosome partitioning protein